MTRTQDAVKAKSYLLYSFRSLHINRKSYVILFISIVCMVLMSSNLIIYNSSLSSGEDKMIYNTYGTYHAHFDGLDMSVSETVNMAPHVAYTTRVPYIVNVPNPNTASSVKSAKLALYTGGLDDLCFTLTEGEFPGLFEILINDTLSRAFNVYVGDTITFRTGYVDSMEKDLTFKVSGMYSGAKATDNYLFTSQETYDSLLGGKDAADYCAVDTYVKFNTGSRVMIKKYTTDIMNLLSIKKSEHISDMQAREAYMNNPVVSMKRFYEKTAFLVTMLISIIPAGIAILVFIVLDIYKSMKDLSILSMIGTTPKQFFRILFLKYFYIFLAAFPCGLGISAALIGLLCLACRNMNYNEQIYLRFYISPLSVMILFALCLLILFGLTYFISRKTTSGTYTEMLSGTASMNNIFVERTSGSLLLPGSRGKKLAVLFFVRNRNVNLLFCCVISVLIAVITFFTVALSQEVGNLPVGVDRGDYEISGDTLRDTSVSTVSDDVINELINTSGIERVIKSYYEYPSYSGASPTCFIPPAKRVSQVQANSVFPVLEKTMMVPAYVISEEQDQAELLYGQYVISGSLDNIYDGSGRIAVFVHVANTGDGYYDAGDIIEIKPAYEIDERTGELTSNTQYRQYTIGAVLFIRFDEYENINVLRILTTPDVYTELTYIDNPTSVDVKLDDDSDEGVAAILPDLRKICSKYNLIYNDKHELFMQQRSAMISSVLFYVILWCAIIFILVMMLVSLTGFMIRSHIGNIKTLSMLGTKKKDLFIICGTEYLICGIISALAGGILSLAVLIAYSMATQTIFNGYVTAILFLSVILSAALAVFIPYFTSRNYFMKEKYQSE